MSDLSADLDTACRSLCRHIRTAHRNGQMALALVVCPATTKPEPIQVMLDQAALRCVLRYSDAQVRTLEQILADWSEQLRQVVTAGLAPVGLVLVNAGGVISSGPWTETLAVLHLSEESFHEAVNAAIDDVVPFSCPQFEDENFPISHSC